MIILKSFGIDKVLVISLIQDIQASGQTATTFRFMARLEEEEILFLSFIHREETRLEHYLIMSLLYISYGSVC